MNKVGFAAGLIRRSASVLAQWPRVAAATCRGLTVFTVHDVTDTPSEFQVAESVATPTATFRSQAEWIARTFEVVSLEDLGRNDLPASAAAITFDDAWEGTFENGFAILDDLGLPATAFLNFCGIDEGVDATAFVAFNRNLANGYPTMADRHGRPDDPEPFRAFQGRLATETILHQWDGHPGFTFGSHLYWHVVSLGATMDEFKDSFHRNEARLETLQRRIRHVSFPFGQPGDHFNATHVETCRRLGAERVYSARSRVNRSTVGFLLDRTSLPVDEDRGGAILANIHHRRLVEQVRLIPDPLPDLT